MDHIYDVIILGAGPAGLSAGLYAGRSRLDTLIIEKGQAGGQIINTDEIENYPGQIVEGETGVSLVRRMYEQTEQFGAEHVRDTITNAELSGDIKVLTGEKDTYQAKNIIIATGAYARPIGCKGEQEYKGRGISYCATCDANFFTDLEVYVAGGGDAAVEEAVEEEPPQAVRAAAAAATPVTFRKSRRVIIVLFPLYLFSIMYCGPHGTFPRAALNGCMKKCPRPYEP